MKKVYVKSGESKRLIGSFGNGVFKTTRKLSKHLYRKTNSWGIDAKAFRDLYDNKGLHTVMIYDLDTQTTYTTNAKNFIEFGEYLHFKPHRIQIFLSLNHFDRK